MDTVAATVAHIAAGTTRTQLRRAWWAFAIGAPLAMAVTIWGIVLSFEGTDSGDYLGTQFRYLGLLLLGLVASNFWIKALSYRLASTPA